MKEQNIENSNNKNNEDKIKNKSERFQENLLGPKLVEENKKPGCCRNCLASIFPCLKKVDTTSMRKLYLDDPSKNVTNWSNKEENNKYNIITFIPITLFNQFRQFGNFFYLMMTISQFIPELAVGFLITYIAPLAFVITVSMIKELYDDINRRIQDKKTNSSKITAIKPSQDKTKLIPYKKPASELQVGDVVELKKDSRVPADLVVLKTFNESEENQAFIRTDQLDGETDWKLRKAPGITQNMEDKKLFSSNIECEFEPPSKLIYEFKGVIRCLINGKEKTEPLNLENTMWASTVVASQKVIGVVIYTGKETRAKMNLSTPKLKVGILDQEINKLNIYLFVITLIIAFIISSAKGFNSKFFFNVIKYIVLFCSIIPISLRVNLDVSKLYFSALINRDTDIPGTIARNRSIPEELGRISYVFSDKTGTLTKNEMIFKVMALSTETFTEKRFEDLKGIISDVCQKENNDAPLLDVFRAKENNLISENNLSVSNNSNKNPITISKKKIWRKKEKISRKR